MDMRNLHTSLPAAYNPRRQRRGKKQPSKAALLDAFRAAALSVTNLYKTSEKERDKIYESGYQDALGDILDFLDREDIGLGDGEGWKVRQWATARYKGGSGSEAGSSTESEDEERARSSSPAHDRKEELQAENRSDSAPPAVEVVPVPTPEPAFTAHSPAIPLGRDFTFQSSRVYPTVTDIDMGASDPSAGAAGQRGRIPRNARNTTRSASRTPTLQLGSLGAGAGLKRKPSHSDFFDFQNFPGNGRDGFGGGGKRGRLA